jgi:Rieske Fe-S protein
MGDSGQGLTHGVMGAMLNTSLILGEDSPWRSVYAPDRTPLAAARNFLRENLTVPQNLAEYVAPGEITSLREIEPGEGAILRRGFEKIAAYRDKAGELHLHSASCTHIGCHLHWNSFESCWDRHLDFVVNDFNDLRAVLPNFSDGLGNLISKPACSFAIAATAKPLRSGAAIALDFRGYLCGR